MAHLSPLRIHDTTVLLLAVLARLAQLPDSSPLRRHDLVWQMLKRGETATLPSDARDVLTDELLQVSAQFPTFDALLATYDTAIAEVTDIVAGLDLALAGRVAGTPLFGQHPLQTATPTREAAAGIRRAQ